MTVKLTWLGHTTIILKGTSTVAIDPWKVSDVSVKADVIIVSHSHYDHLSVDDARTVALADAAIVAPADCRAQLPSCGDFFTLEIGAPVEVKGVKIEAVPAYNLTKQFHPKASGWCGAVVTLDGKRIYYAGDTDFVPEMKDLMQIDVAFVPVGGTYTMDWRQAAEAVNAFRPQLAVPYHWGDIVGSVEDARKFAKHAYGEVRVLAPGESVEID